MTPSVGFLSEEIIEREADHLISESEKTFGYPIEAPVPVEEITTYHLALRLGFDDLHKKTQIPMSGDRPDIFGAIWFKDETILIDQSIDPSIDGPMLGRYRFSVAHETGHWQLHRDYFLPDPDQPTFFDRAETPGFVCRASGKKDRAEWQADYFASCLLMPRRRVMSAWENQFGNTSARMIDRPNRIVVPDDIQEDEFVAAVRVADACMDDQALESFALPFAKQFKVSAIAMRIRLEKLGLLLRKRPKQDHLAFGI